MIVNDCQHLMLFSYGDVTPEKVHPGTHPMDIMATSFETNPYDPICHVHKMLSLVDAFPQTPDSVAKVYTDVATICLQPLEDRSQSWEWVSTLGGSRWESDNFFVMLLRTCNTFNLAIGIRKRPAPP